jgi:hypothetical protein
MGAEIANVSGRVLTLKVSGTLTEPELNSMQNAATDIFATGGKWRPDVHGQRVAHVSHSVFRPGSDRDSARMARR